MGAQLAVITGKTFDARGVLKEYGAKWDAGRKAWTMPAADWLALDAKVTVTFSRTKRRLLDALVVTVEAAQ
jgi:hypothetical protein